MKRSAQVALLLMGVGGVGAGAYALMPPRNNCVPQAGAQPSAVAPNPTGAPGAEPCPPRRQGGIGSSGRSYYSSWSGSSNTSGRTSSTWWGPIFGSGRSASSTVPAAGRSSSAGGGSFASSGVARGGFGGTGHGMSASS